VSNDKLFRATYLPDFSPLHDVLVSLLVLLLGYNY
jgi:hypothetical protein